MAHLTASDGTVPLSPFTEPPLPLTTAAAHRRPPPCASHGPAFCRQVLVVAYVLLGYFLLGYLNGMRGVDIWYFLATTVTTVGFGDLYPDKQVGLSGRLPLP